LKACRQYSFSAAIERVKIVLHILSKLAKRSVESDKRMRMCRKIPFESLDCRFGKLGKNPLQNVHGTLKEGICTAQVIEFAASYLIALVFLLQMECGQKAPEHFGFESELDFPHPSPGGIGRRRAQRRDERLPMIGSVEVGRQFLVMEEATEYGRQLREGAAS